MNTRMMEMNTLDFQNIISETKTIILPIGACEVWGPHLPLGADTIIAEEIANMLSQRTGWPIGPTLTVGDSIMVWGPGTVTVRPESLGSYLEDVCNSLIKHGVRRFVFMSPHVGNTPVISNVAWKMRMNEQIISCIFDWWRFIQPISAKEKTLYHEGWMAHGHASEAGTSCFLYLRPDLVKMDRACVTENKVKGFYDYPGAIRFHPFEECSDTWVLGDATKATVEKGKKIIEAALNSMEQFLHEQFAGMA